ncbi:hypothetical protein F5B17DRAFT_417105 [Nemania serpens]|nr:hypothetical protein F5B17DRAFT_417105 [Nemania serpens]
MSASQSPQPSLTRLPGELSRLIYSHLCNCDIKNLRLVSSFFHRTAVLRLDRVFISANPRNIEVFEAVAKHDEFRAHVREVVWDDALLASSRTEQDPAGIGFFADCDDSPGRDPCPDWYWEACELNMERWISMKAANWDKPDDSAREQQVAAQISLKESWAYYRELLRQQREVLDSQAHVRALESGIGRFPALRTITITAATHGRVFTPVYETPMIRSFPWGFNYAIPCWPLSTTSQPECPVWDEESRIWQGFRVVLEVLARKLDSGRVRELHVKSFQLPMGLNSRLFEQPCRTLANFQMVLSRASFQSLQLDLMVTPFNEQADVFNCGYLKHALAGAAGGRGLRSVALGTNYEEAGSIVRTWYIPLETIYDSQSLQRVEHFRISRFPVMENDLLALLAALPLSTRTVELSFLEFLEGSHRSLLYQIRDTLNWQDRRLRPRMSIGFNVKFDHPGQAIWIEQEVYAFLYEGGPNPFGDDPELGANNLGDNIGMLKDALNPEFQRPNLVRERLVEIGYLLEDGTTSPALSYGRTS